MDPNTTALLCVRLANYIDESNHPSKSAVLSDLNYIISSVDHQAVDWEGLKGKLTNVVQKAIKAPGKVKDFWDDSKQSLDEWLDKRARIDSYKTELKSAKAPARKLITLLRNPSNYLPDIFSEDGADQLSKIIVKYIKENPNAFKDLKYDRVNKLMQANVDKLGPEAAVKLLRDTNTDSKQDDERVQFNRELSKSMRAIVRYIDELIGKADEVEDTHSDAILKELAPLGLDESALDDPDAFAKGLFEAVESEVEEEEAAPDVDSSDVDTNNLEGAIADLNDRIKSFESKISMTDDAIKQAFGKEKEKTKQKYDGENDYVKKKRIYHNALKAVKSAYEDEFQSALGSLIEAYRGGGSEEEVSKYADASDAFINSMARIKGLPRKMRDELRALTQGIFDEVNKL